MVDKKSRVWSDQGVEPDPGEETYEGQARPIAEYDNWAMWAVTTDISSIISALGELQSIESITKLTLDTQSNRGTAGTAGHVYIERDTGRIFVDDGNAWSEVGVSEYQQLANREHGMEDHDGSVASSTDVQNTQSNLSDHESDETNPHNVTETQTGAEASLSSHEAETGGVHGIDGTDTVAGQSDVDAEVESHRQNEVHDAAQPNQTHGNEDHNETYETESGAQARVDSHESDTGGVHGVDGTDTVAGQSDVDAVASDLSDHEGAANPHSSSASDTDLSNHEAATDNVHGVADGDSVAATSDVNSVSSNLSDHESASNPHSGSASNTELNNHEAATDEVHGIAAGDTVAGQSDVDAEVESHRQNETHATAQPNQAHGNEDHTSEFETTTGAQSRVDTHEAETGDVHGVAAGDSVAGQSDVDAVSSNLSDHEGASNPHSGSASNTDLNNHESSTGDVHGVGANDVASTADVSDIQASSDVSHDQTQGGTGGTPHDHADPDDPVTQFGPGTVADGEVLKNEGGNLVGAAPGSQIERYATVQDLPDPENLTEPTIAYVEDEDDYIGVFQE